MELNRDMYRLRKIVPVSSKKDPICANNIYLSSKRRTTFGRVVSDDVQERLLSKVTPLMISRKHATIVIENGLIKISDHNSINGVYVNNKRIRTGVPHSVRTGDKIAFGCGVGNIPPEFEYVLEAVHTHKRQDTTIALPGDLLASPSKRKRVSDQPVVTIIESHSAQIKEQEDKIRMLTRELQQKESDHNEILGKFEETEKGLLVKFEQHKLELEKERSDAEDHLRNLLEKQLTEKEDFLRSEFDEQIKYLQNEKELVEKNLHNELSKKLTEKDKVYQQELEHQKSMLEQAMLSKEQEKCMLFAELKVKEGLIEKYKCVEENQRQLEDCLEELRRQIQEKESQLKEQQEVTRKIELDAKQTVIQTMEDEFTCIICQELFIEATTLPCAHTFCELCLRLWMRKKKNCPVCRRRIKDKAVRSVVLDSAVEKMIESMDDDTRQSRKILLHERTGQKQKDDATEDPDGIKNMIHRPEDNNDTDEQQPRNGRNNYQDPRNRRESYRRRSRSRSPRFQNNRHRPYPDHRYNNGHVGFQDNHQQQHHQNIPSLVHHFHNQARYYQHERNENLNYISSNFRSQVNPNYGYNNNSSLRCYICGGTDHVARFCQRR